MVKYKYMNTLNILIMVAIFLLFVVFGIIIYAFNSFPSERERDLDEVMEDNKK